ncbi:hypothetical protein GCM10023338_17480 [Wohlfahrtiimonas larvae]|uniref:Transglycosylase SLT domain-containing protein n=2 Tax=Wohlfahrtiimonas larvae TaxID=1157986 RepID=A0ABP9MVZ5_9GAMM
MLRFLRLYLRSIGTVILTLASLAFYSFAFRATNDPQNMQFDIVSTDQDNLEWMPDATKFWGLSRQLTIFTDDELEYWRGIMESFQYHNDIRRNKRQKMTNYLVMHYNMPERDAKILVRSADANAHKYKIDLELLMAVIFVESTYKITAESKYGAIGLMQVVPKWHLDKIQQYGGVDALYDIRTNISIGTEILMEYFEKEGNIRQALHRYNGSKNDKTLKYSNRVLQKYNELRNRNYLENVQLTLRFDIISPAMLL